MDVTPAPVSFTSYCTVVTAFNKHGGWRTLRSSGMRVCTKTPIAGNVSDGYDGMEADREIDATATGYMDSSWVGFDDP